MEDKPRICVIHTGGTFGMSGLPGPLQPDSYSLNLSNHIPEIDDIADTTVISPFNIDSSQMEPDKWGIIVDVIKDNYDEHNGFVIIHGTDTMSYTAAALSFMLENLGKPVILTGSQLPLAEPRTDARLNLLNSILLASQPIPEVSVCFNTYLYRGNRIKKRDIWSYDAFYSPNMEPLAKLGLNVRLSKTILTRDSILTINPAIDPRVWVIRVVPGFHPTQLDLMIHENIKGLILEAFGAGNLPVSLSQMHGFLKEATENDIPVVIVSQSPYGTVNLELYEAGRKASTAGVIPGGDMTVECATIKLMIALGRFDNLTDIRNYMLANVAGERSK